MSDKNDNKKELEAFFKSYADAEEVLDFRMADDLLGQDVEVISTGSPGLNDALGCWGIPLGRLVQFYGPPGSGKTLVSMLLIKEAQKKDKEAKQVVIDAENSFSPDWANTVGCDTSRIIIVDGDLAVQGRSCFTMLLGKPKEDKQHHLIGKTQEGLLDKIKNKEININLIVLDSLGSIIPPIEDVSEIGKSNISPLPRFLSTVLKKLSLEVKKANIPFVMINHKKANMDPYGADHTFSGGNAYGHFLSANIYFEAVQRKDAAILDNHEEKIGGPIRAKIEKSKFGPWPRQCEFKVDFGKGIVDTHEEIANLAIKYGIVSKPNNVSHQFGDKTFRGFDNFCKALLTDAEMLSDIEKKLEEVRKNKFKPREPVEETASKAETLEEQESDDKDTKTVKRGRPAKKAVGE